MHSYFAHVQVQASHRFSVTDYYRLAEIDVLRADARVELLDGRIAIFPVAHFRPDRDSRKSAGPKAVLKPPQSERWRAVR